MTNENPKAYERNEHTRRRPKTGLDTSLSLKKKETYFVFIVPFLAPFGVNLGQKKKNVFTQKQITIMFINILIDYCWVNSEKRNTANRFGLGQTTRHYYIRRW